MVSIREQAAELLRLVREAQRILCVCHRGPDGDAVGSLLGFGLLIERAFGGEKSVSFHCKDVVPDVYLFLPGALRVQCLPQPQHGDLFVFVDCAEPKLTNMDTLFPQCFDGSIPSVNIDHHPDNPCFASVNIVVPEAASTCGILLHLAEALGWTIESDIATCLLTGVYTDTGGLLHSNTSAEVYRMVAKLLRCGARHQRITSHVFRTAKLSTLRLWGKVLEKIILTQEGGAVSAVTEGDFRAAGAQYSELTGAIDYVNAVPGMRFSLVLSEREGKVKGSLRTLRDDVDVSAMASTFQGGGHRKAAGFSLLGKLAPEVRWTVVEGA